MHYTYNLNYSFNLCSYSIASKSSLIIHILAIFTRNVQSGLNVGGGGLTRGVSIFMMKLLLLLNLFRIFPTLERSWLKNGEKLNYWVGSGQNFKDWVRGRKIVVYPCDQDFNGPFETLFNICFRNCRIQ